VCAGRFRFDAALAAEPQKGKTPPNIVEVIEEKRTPSDKHG
jgi:hypothetical protein